MKTAHFTMLGVQIQPREADAEGYLHYREGYLDLSEDEQTPAERWLATQERRIAAWRDTSSAAAALGRRGRAVNSEAQQSAARANGAKGGAPPVTYYACSECSNAIARGEPGWEDWFCPEHPSAMVQSIRVTQAPAA